MSTSVLSNNCNYQNRLFENFDPIDPSDLNNTSNKDGKDLDIDIQKLSKELLVPVKKLEQKLSLDKAEFDEYVETMRSKYGAVLEDARTEYENIIKLYDEKGDHLISKVSNEMPEISKEVMMKAVRHAMLALANRDLDEDARIYSKSLSKLNIELLVGKTKSGDLKIFKWQGDIKISARSKSFLGQGCFGRVQSGEDFTKGDRAAIKFSSPKKISGMPYKKAQKMARDDIKSEGDLLFNVNEGVVNEGLQPPPRMMFSVSQKGNVEVGMLQDLYPLKDLHNVLTNDGFDDLTKTEALKIAHQLLKGLVKLHEKAIHGDIKLDNCFVRKDVNGELEVVIADLGGAKLIDPDFHYSNKNLNNIHGGYALGTTVTPGFFTKGDNNEAAKHKRTKNQKMWVETHKKRDLFALVTTLWSIYTNGYTPYVCSVMEIFPNTRVLHGRNKVEQLLGKELTNSLVQALSEKPYNRPTIQELIEVIENEMLAP